MRNVWREPYIVCNLIFAGVLAALLAYFGIFSSVGDYPIHAVASGTLTSTGLQRALSELMRGNLDAALQFNRYSVGIFAFFVVQLIMRIAFSAIYIFCADKRRPLKSQPLMTPNLFPIGLHFCPIYSLFSFV